MDKYQAKILNRLKKCLDKILKQAKWESRNQMNFVISDYWSQMQNQIELWFFVLKKIRENEYTAIKILEELEKQIENNK